MKHLKKFESFGSEEPFDLGNYPVEDQEKEMQECEPCKPEEDEIPNFDTEDGTEDWKDNEEDESDEENEEERRRLWGDESTVVERISSFDTFNEKKKLNPGLQAYLDKKAGKKGKDKESEKKDKKSKNEMPDFPDVDKDGDKKESIKKAYKEAKAKKK